MRKKKLEEIYKRKAEKLPCHAIQYTMSIGCRQKSRVILAKNTTEVLKIKRTSPPAVAASPATNLNSLHFFVPKNNNIFYLFPLEITFSIVFSSSFPSSVVSICASVCVGAIFVQGTYIVTFFLLHLQNVSFVVCS